MRMSNLDRKNILLVSFDDCFAYHHYRTAFGEALQVPNLDRITAEATHFQSAYCQAPVCGPSRASLMSAQTPHQLGIFNNKINVFDKIDPTDIWSHKLKESGYFCSSGGKIHHGYKPLRRRHHKVIYSDEQKRFGDDFSLPDGVAKKRYHGIRGGWGTTDEEDDGIFYDSKSANSAIEFLETYDVDQPFYREVGFFSPHGPRYTPARFKDLYNVKNFQKPSEWVDGFDDHPYTEEHMPYTQALREEGDDWWRFNVRNYFAALSHGDYQLGRVWDALRRSKFCENTIVVIISDHGFLLGARDRFYKSTIWEQSAGVPLIIFDPDQAQPQVIQDPVALLDVGPTILDYSGVPPLENSVGRTLRPQVQGARCERTVPTFRFDNVSIRKDHYRLARYMDGSSQLFDLNSDIWNHRDLKSGHPAFEMMQAELVKCCAEYGLDLNDPNAPSPIPT